MERHSSCSGLTVVDDDIYTVIVIIIISDTLFTTGRRLFHDSATPFCLEPLFSMSLRCFLDFIGPSAFRGSSWPLDITRIPLLLLCIRTKSSIYTVNKVRKSTVISNRVTKMYNNVRVFKSKPIIC